MKINMRLLLLCVAMVTAAQGDLVHTRVHRFIDISSHIASTITSIEVKNEASQASSRYTVAVPSTRAESLAYISLETTQGNVSFVREPAAASGGHMLFHAPLVLAPGETAAAKIYTSFVGLLAPLPASIAQNENQLVKYTDTHHFYSPYRSQEEETTVELGTTVIESRSSLPPSKVAGSSLRYGPYKATTAFSSGGAGLHVHYECNRPFVTMTSVERRVEVSHWGGAVSISDDYGVLHSGAVLKGPFSRFEYQRNPKAHGASAFRALTATLPADASGVYYGDDTGNITTATLTSTNTSLIVAMQARFPMFGGWRNRFQLLYELPSGSLLTREEGREVLSLAVHIPIEGAVARRLTVRVGIPEGATDARIEQGDGLVQFEELARETAPRHLDWAGKEVLVLRSLQPLVPAHGGAGPLRISYKLGWIGSLRRPLALAVTAVCLLAGFVGLSVVTASLNQCTERDVVAALLEQYALAVKTKSSLLKERELKREGDKRLAQCNREIEVVKADLGKISRSEAVKLRRLEEHWPSLEEARLKAKTEEQWAEVGSRCEGLARDARDSLAAW